MMTEAAMTFVGNENPSLAAAVTLSVSFDKYHGLLIDDDTSNPYLLILCYIPRYSSSSLLPLVATFNFLFWMERAQAKFIHAQHR